MLSRGTFSATIRALDTLIYMLVCLCVHVKVMKEAAKTGASAILLWYNVVEDSTPENKELHRMVRKTSNSEARHIPVPNGEYTFQATAGSGDIQKCAVMFQYNTGTETAKSILERVTNAVNNTALKHLQQEADNAALASTVAGSSEPAAKKTAAPKANHPPITLSPVWLSQHG